MALQELQTTPEGRAEPSEASSGMNAYVPYRVAVIRGKGSNHSEGSETHPEMYVLDLSPRPGGDLPQRLAAAAADAQRRGLDVLAVRLHVGCADVRPSLSGWLKRADRKHGLEASWPADANVGHLAGTVARKGGK